MMKNLLLILCLTPCLVTKAIAQSTPLSYPVTRTVDQVDDYHGTRVADPYRWLEDDRSPETAEWVKAQNHVTDNYLAQIPYRDQLKKRMEQLINYPRYGTLFHRGEGAMGEWYYFYKNDGLQNQYVLYRQKGLEASTTKTEVVVDPNQLAADGTTRLGNFSLSKDGRYAAYTLSKAGSDWQEIFVMDMQTLKNLPDHIQWVKFSSIAWKDKGFYYSAYDEPGAGTELSGQNKFQKIKYHQLGNDQAQDRLIYEDKEHPLRYHYCVVSDDEQYLFLANQDGTNTNDLLYKDLKKGGDWKPIFEGFESESIPIDHLNGQIVLYHNQGAPNFKVSLFDTQTGSMKDLIAEQPEKLERVTLAGGKLFAQYLKDVTTRIHQYNLKTGHLENEIQLPGLGTATGFGGQKDDKVVFYTFSSFTVPPSLYRYDIATGKSTVFKKVPLTYRQEDYETNQVFYTSKDGTLIPMFLTHRKSLKQDGTNPTLLYAYGGFNISVKPSFYEPFLALLEQGGIVAVANLRGGGEYGEEWHRQGMKEKKQNVFDDYIAAAEYLIKEKYTSPARLAARGGSNGGLLVGAVINQRPDLFRVAFPQVGVMDMLRFHKFTVGYPWSSEYGNSDKAEEFRYLYAYSPLHNIRPGLNYPATMVTTADHDDRVVPAHSFKYTATLQKTYRGPNPVLIRVETNSGHGSVSTKKGIELNADIVSFMLWNMGVKRLTDEAN